MIALPATTWGRGTSPKNQVPERHRPQQLRVVERRQERRLGELVRPDHAHVGADPQYADDREDAGLECRDRRPEERHREAAAREGADGGVEQRGERRLGRREHAGGDLEEGEEQRAREREQRRPLEHAGSGPHHDRDPGEPDHHRPDAMRPDPLREQRHREHDDEQGSCERDRDRVRQRHVRERHEQHGDGDAQHRPASELQERTRRCEGVPERLGPERRVPEHEHRDGERVPPHHLDAVQARAHVLRRRVHSGGEPVGHHEEQRTGVQVADRGHRERSGSLRRSRAYYARRGLAAPPETSGARGHFTLRIALNLGDSRRPRSGLWIPGTCNLALCLALVA